MAYKRLKNFACVELLTKEKKLLVHVKGDAAAITFEEGFVRDTTNIGTWGTGNVELTLRNLGDLERAKPLILKSYEGN